MILPWFLHETTKDDILEQAFKKHKFVSCPIALVFEIQKKPEETKTTGSFAISIQKQSCFKLKKGYQDIKFEGSDLSCYWVRTKKEVIRSPLTPLKYSGGGFLGSHICRLLVDSGYKVRAIDLHTPKFPRKVEGVEYYELDLVECKDADLEKVLDGCSGVIHAAGIVALYDVPELLHNVHVYSTSKLLALAAESSSVFAFIQTSTSGVVHNGSFSAIAVPHIASYSSIHHSDYGATKHKAEVMTRLANNPNGFLTTSLRLPAVFGYGDGMAATKMLDEGLNVCPGNLHAKVEMLYVKNAAQAHLDALLTLHREAMDEKFRHRKIHANGNAYFVTNSSEQPEQLPVVELWKQGRKILGIHEELYVIPESLSKLLAYFVQFIYWYLQGHVPATRNSFWNFTPKSLAYMINDNTFGGQKETVEGIRYKPLFSTQEAFYDLRKEYEHLQMK